MDLRAELKMESRGDEFSGFRGNAGGVTGVLLMFKDQLFPGLRREPPLYPLLHLGSL